MASYSFPLLPPAEVVTCLAELGCTVTEAQLAKPEPEVVAQLFEELVCLLVGVTRCVARQQRTCTRTPSTATKHVARSPRDTLLGALRGDPTCVQKRSLTA
jgi:Nuf2 family